MKYVALLSGGKDSCFNLLHCQKNGHELIAAASLGPENGKGQVVHLDSNAMFADFLPLSRSPFNLQRNLTRSCTRLLDRMLYTWSHALSMFLCIDV